MNLHLRILLYICPRQKRDLKHLSLFKMFKERCFLRQWKYSTDKQWSTKDSHKPKYRVTSNTNPTCPGSLQWLLYIDLTVYQCMRKMNQKKWLPCVEKVLKYYLGICMRLALGLTADCICRMFQSFALYQGEHIIFTTEH
jgi:hypothetical protein